MKVLHVIPSLANVHGGPTHAVAMMERALAAQQVHVETASTDDDGPGRRMPKPSGIPLQENGVTRWYFRKAFDFYKPSPSFARWIWREVGRYDVVHIHALFSFTSLAAAFAARRARIPYVIRPLGTLDGYGINRRRPWLKRLSLRFLEGPVLRDAAAVHFTSEQEAREAQALGIAWKPAMIPLAVEAQPRRNPAVREGATAQFTLLFLSRLDPKKNLEALLDAIATLQPATPSVRLLVAGSGEPGYVAGLRTRCRSLRIEDRVQWLGHVQAEDKAAALAAADLFVLPSFSENFGIAVAEALAAGVPCLVSRGIAISQAVVDAGAGIAVAPEPADLAAALSRIIGCQEELPGMSVRAARLARESFSADVMGVRLLQLYRQCTQPSPQESE